MIITDEITDAMKRFGEKASKETIKFEKTYKSIDDMMKFSPYPSAATMEALSSLTVPAATMEAIRGLTMPAATMEAIRGLTMPAATMEAIRGLTMPVAAMKALPSSSSKKKTPTKKDDSKN